MMKRGVTALAGSDSFAASLAGFEPATHCLEGRVRKPERFALPQASLRPPGEGNFTRLQSESQSLERSTCSPR